MRNENERSRRIRLPHSPNWLWLPGYRALSIVRRLQQRRWRRRAVSDRAGLEGRVFPRPLPRRIWIYWDRGETAAPDVVRYCIARWRALHDDWSVEVLDRSGAEAIIDMSDMPAGISPAHYADVLRLRLLKRFGGVWADATCLPTRPLDHWLPPLMQSGFFAFAAPGPDRLLANWFLASAVGGVTVARWEERARCYWEHRSKPDTYFWAHYLFEWLVRTDGLVRHGWRSTPKLHAHMAFLLQRAVTGEWDDETVLARLSEAGGSAFPIHKLSWKNGSLARLETLLARLAAKEQQ